MTVSEELAHEALELTFRQLPAEVVHEAKRRVMDTLACAIGGFDSPPSLVLQDLVKDLGGPAEATIHGSGLRTSCMNAALVNGVMVRFTEAMDRSIEGRHGVTQHGHPCEVIPSIIAVAERQHSTGKEVITAIVLGYQLMNRLSYAAGGANAIEKHGWKNEIRAGVIVPLVVGTLMDLTHEQMVNAVGIAGCYTGAGLGVVHHELEKATMARNLRFPYAAYHAIFAALMSQRGFEGPSRVYEGHDGFAEVILRGNVDLARLTRRDEDFNILYTSTKAFPVCGPLQGQTEALLRVVGEHDLTPERVAQIRITTTPLVVRVLGDPATHRYPQTKETADHSAYYVAALVIVDRAVRLNLDQFTPQRLRDPRLRAVIDKIKLIAVPEWKDDQGPTEVEVTTVEGTIYRCRVEYPKGHVLNPLTDGELEEKFRGMASRLMSEAQMREVFTAIYRLDELDDIGELTKMLVCAEAR